MSEESKRPASFKEAGSKMQMGAIEALSAIDKWLQKGQDRLSSAVKDYTEETEDKGFWGNLATLGTTAGCLIFTGGTGLGGCVAAGTAAGAVVRGGIDYFQEGDEAIRDFVTGEPPKTKYYKNKAPEVAKALDGQADKLRDVVDSEWKTDILKQLNDSMTAYSMASGVQKLGGWESANEFIFGGPEAPVPTGATLSPEALMFNQGLESTGTLEGGLSAIDALDAPLPEALGFKDMPVSDSYLSKISKVPLEPFSGSTPLHYASASWDEASESLTYGIPDLDELLQNMIDTGEITESGYTVGSTVSSVPMPELPQTRASALLESVRLRNRLNLNQDQLPLINNIRRGN